MMVNKQFTQITAADLCVKDRFVLSAHSYATESTCNTAYAIDTSEAHITIYTSSDHLSRLIMPKSKVIYRFTPTADDTPRINYKDVITLIAVRSTIVLNLRRLQQGLEPKAVTNGVIHPDGVALWSDMQSLIDPAVHILSKLRFPVTLTAEQGHQINEAMRDYFKFAATMYTYATMRNIGKPAQDGELAIYETLYQHMGKSK